jgi:long-chain acyl-CoA synthetase
MSYQSKPWLKFYTEEVNEHSSIPEISLSQFLAQSSENYENQTALSFYGHQWSFKQVYDIADQFAACLHSTGFKKGDRLAIMLPNCPHYVFSLFGTFRLGGIVTQVNPMYVEREIEYILNNSGSETIVVLEALYPRVKAVQNKTPVKKVIVIGLGKEATDLQDEDISFEAFMKAASSPAPAVEINPREDVAVLQYSGGTTGRSKGVMLTHYNLVANLEQSYDFMFKETEGRPDNPKVMNVLPMFHIYGLTCVTFLGFKAGSNQIILPRFDPKEVMETVKREKPFQFSAVPTMYFALNAQPDFEQYGFDAIKYYNSGGAAMPVEQLNLFERRASANLCEGYGLSEASPVTHFNPPFRHRNAGSIGIPIPSTECKIVDLETGTEEVPVGEPGELCIRGPQVMKGYWNMPDETASTLRDGWLHTGDIARMDEDGYFYIVDRKKDMIIASGFNIYPREIEEVLYQHPDVLETIVIGIPDDYRGETVKAFITKRPGSSVTEGELHDFCRERLAAFKVPRLIEFRDQLPKSAVGKLLKRELVEEERQKRKTS